MLQQCSMGVLQQGSNLSTNQVNTRDLLIQLLLINLKAHMLSRALTTQDQLKLMVILKATQDTQSLGHLPKSHPRTAAKLATELAIGILMKQLNPQGFLSLKMFT